MESEKQTETNPVIKKRNPLVAFLYSLFVPGTGQIYNGQWKKGVTFFMLIVLVIPLAFSFTRVITTFEGSVVFLIVEILVVVIMLTDAVLSAKRRKEYEMKKFNHWYFFLPVVLVFAILMSVFNSSRVLKIEAYRVFATSNSPTLLPGDCLIVNTMAYTHRNPKTGDLIAHRSFEDIFLFRVIGLPGDTIDMKKGELYINGKQLKTEYVGDTIIDTFSLKEYTEELPGGRKHAIYRFDTDKISYPPPADTGVLPIIVPAASYFVMGDSRDNAYDSRFKGCITKNDIVGQAVYTYWRTGEGLVNIDLRKR